MSYPKIEAWPSDGDERLTVRELIAALEPYTVGAEIGAECEVVGISEDGRSLRIDMGSDIGEVPLFKNGPRR